MDVRRVVVGALSTNCYLLFSGKEMAVVDPGGDAQNIIEEIKGTGLVPKYIINTHSHPDHVSANEKIKDATGAVTLKELKEGDEITLGEETLRVLRTPGHTKDSICLLGDNFLVGGDTIFPGGYGRTDLPGGSEEDMRKTLERLKKELSEGVVIYPGHGKPFTIGEWRGLS